MFNTGNEMDVSSRRHIGLHILVICVWVIVLAGMFYLVAKPVRDPSLDFFVYYFGASAIREEKPLYSPETYEGIYEETGIMVAGQYPYPPTLLLFIQPFLFVSPYVGSLLWFSINVGLLLSGVALLFKGSNLQNHRMRVALGLLPLFFIPILMALYLGSVNFLMLVLIVLAYQGFVGRRHYSSGLLLAVATWIKLWPLILIAYFGWKREWKVLLGAVIGLVLVGALTLALAGVDQTTSFFNDRLAELATGTFPGLDHHNQSISGIFAKMFDPSSEYVRPLIHNPTVAQQGSRIATWLLIVTTVLLCSWPINLKDRKQFSTEFTLVIIATLLIAGWGTWEASLTLLLPAYFFIAEEIQQEQMTSWKLIAVSIASIILINIHRVLWTVGNPDKQSLPWFLLIFPFLGLILVWLVFVRRRVQEIKTRPVDSLSAFYWTAYSTALGRKK